jgi:hypothetical protein
MPASIGLLLGPYGTALIFIAICTILLITPILRYLRAGWRYKKDDITNSLDEESKSIYLQRFLKITLNNRSEEAKIFDLIYNKKFGRRHYIWPTILISILILSESSLVIDTISPSDPNFWSPGVHLSSISLAALAGAYMWVVGDFISRARRWDFSPADILWGTLRLFIAVPLGLSVGSIVGEARFAPFVAFALGAFPLETIQSILRQAAYKILGLELGPTETTELTKLDGVDKSIAERLLHEDINSIVQLAYCDPIQATMRTNLSFNTVTDLVSQALAWAYLKDKLDLLRPLGLRGAYEIREIFEAIESRDKSEKENALNLVSTIAKRLELEEKEIWFVFSQIAYDPYIDFIYEVWSLPD